jgi:hypothetical protein
MTKSWPVGLLIAGLLGGNAFADCVPSPDTPTSVIEYFQKLNKPLPEKFCAKEVEPPQNSEHPSQEQDSEQASQEPPAYEDAPPSLERRGPPEYLPVPEPRYPHPYDAWSRLAFDWLYSELHRHHHKNHKHKHHKHKHHDDND